MTITNPCPDCSQPVTRQRVFLGNRELFADALCCCDTCDDLREAEATAVKEATPLAVWKRNLPAKYHSAHLDRVPPLLLSALSWSDSRVSGGLGITGPVGKGKSMALALALLGKGRFCWVTGTALREIATMAASGEGGERIDARRLWERYLDAPMLAIDDLDKAFFSEAWASKLFELLESRTSKLRPTLWTANHGPGQLASRISRQSKDDFAGDAIERRLVQSSLVISI